MTNLIQIMISSTLEIVKIDMTLIALIIILLIAKIIMRTVKECLNHV